MKKDTHPESRKVLFHDTSSDEKFLLLSTVETEETGEFEGEEYPKMTVEMSSESHPFYTGVERVVDTTGQVEKFNARFEKAQNSQVSTEEETSESSEEGTTEKDDSEAEETEA